MKTSIIDKYNTPVPRYTSYPPANYFGEMTNQQYLEAVEQSNKAVADNLSFYIHVPFCRHLCHYCGCNSYPMANAEKVERYVKALHHEIDLLVQQLDPSRRISQIHYGGGSPTALPLKHIKELNEHLLSAFDTIEHPEIAIECHPGYLTEDDWKMLADCGFTRFSLGIQDFDVQVLKNVNRRPSLLPVDTIFSILRAAGAKINMDFLYGLPGQTVESFRNAIEQAIVLRPDRLVTFSYAHVPWVNKRQLVLEKLGLPLGEEKAKMFDTAATALKAAGYQPIGMDHFVLPDDELAKAVDEHRLHRNFQGYCTRRITAQVYAFGVTGISQLETAYAQNTKSIDQYIESIESEKLCVAKGYVLNRNEQITREVIESIMCNNHIDWNDVAQRLHLTIEQVKQATAYSKTKLDELASDGLIVYNDNEIRMTTEGLPFVRNVAASFDRLMENTTKHFSKPI